MSVIDSKDKKYVPRLLLQISNNDMVESIDKVVLKEALEKLKNNYHEYNTLINFTKAYV